MILFLRFLFAPVVLDIFRYIKHEIPCLTPFPNISKFVKNTRLSARCLQMWLNTIFPVSYIT